MKLVVRISRIARHVFPQTIKLRYELKMRTKPLMTSVIGLAAIVLTFQTFL